MNGQLRLAKVEDAPAETGARSIKDIISDLSRPVNPQRLKQRQQGGRTLDYMPWYQAVRYLDLRWGRRRDLPHSHRGAPLVAQTITDEETNHDRLSHTL
jgi:hypothetical protein